MIGGLQGDFRDLDNKYLKQNILKYPKISVENILRCRSEIAWSFRNTQQHCAEWLLSHPGMKYPDVKCRRTEFSGYEMSRVAKLSGSTSSGFHQDDMRAKLSCSRWMITYPIRIWCPDGKHWLKWASLATAHVPPLSNGVSGRPVRVYSLHGFQRTLLNLRFALVIKKLSKH